MKYLAVFTSLVLLTARPAAAQSDDRRFQAGVQLAGAVSNEFDSTDLGAGGRLSWHPTAVLGLEGEIDVYPAPFGDRPAFSKGLVEGLFGATIGPRIGRLRPFARLRPGFVMFREAPGPIACILIFPPPLHCTLAAGRTVFAVDLGGGVEWLPSGRTFVRVDAGDRVVRYPSPAIGRNGTVVHGAFASHDFRFAIGGGVRF